MESLIVCVAEPIHKHNTLLAPSPLNRWIISRHEPFSEPMVHSIAKGVRIWSKTAKLLYLKGRAYPRYSQVGVAHCRNAGALLVLAKEVNLVAVVCRTTLSRLSRALTWLVCLIKEWKDVCNYDSDQRERVGCCDVRTLQCVGSENSRLPDQQESIALRTTSFLTKCRTQALISQRAFTRLFSADK